MDIALIHQMHLVCMKIRYHRKKDWPTSRLCLSLIVMMQMPVQSNRPLINPTVCVGITAFVVGTAIGIGIGVLISNNRYRGVGGGIWFGKRRRRSLGYQDIDQEEEEVQEAFQIIENINEGATKYQ